MSKLYDSKLDHEVGYPAEKAVLEYLHDVKEWWWSIIHWPYGEMGVDIAIVTNKVWFVDVERRRNWKTGQEKFPFSTIHVPARKRAMIEKRSPFIYFSVREDLQVAALIKGEVILESRIAPCSNCETATPDLFYHIPIDKILRYRRMNNGVD